MLGRLGLLQIQHMSPIWPGNATDVVARIDRFRLEQPNDAGLIELTAWAGLIAARRVAGWIPVELGSRLTWAAVQGGTWVMRSVRFHRRRW